MILIAFLLAPTVLSLPKPQKMHCLVTAGTVSNLQKGSESPVTSPQDRRKGVSCVGRLEVGENRVHHAWGEVLACEAKASVHDLSSVSGTLKGGADIEVERLTLGCKIPHLVENCHLPQRSQRQSLRKWASHQGL